PFDAAILTRPTRHIFPPSLVWYRGRNFSIAGWELQQVGLRSADRNQAEQSLGADISVDPERHSRGKKDAHAGGGYRTRNLEALLQTICPSRPRSVLPFQS